MSVYSILLFRAFGMIANFLIVSIASISYELESVNELLMILFGSQLLGTSLGHGANTLILERVSRGTKSKSTVIYFTLPVSRIILTWVVVNFLCLFLPGKLVQYLSLFNQAVAFILINLLSDYLRVSDRPILGAFLAFCLIPLVYCVCLTLLNLLPVLSVGVSGVVNLVSVVCLFVFCAFSLSAFLEASFTEVVKCSVQRSTFFDALQFLPYAVVAMFFMQLEYWIANRIFSEQIILDLTIAWRMGAVFSIPFTALSFVLAKRFGSNNAASYLTCYREDAFKLILKYFPLYLAGACAFVFFGEGVLKKFFPLISDDCLVFSYMYLGYHLLSLMIGPVELYQLLNGGKLKVTLVSILLGGGLFISGEFLEGAAYQIVAAFLAFKLFAKVYLACSKGAA